jgi:hypothetical protein
MGAWSTTMTREPRLTETIPDTSKQSWWEQRNSEPLSHELSPNEARIQRQAEARARYHANPAYQQKQQEKKEKKKERAKREKEERQKAKMANITRTGGAASSLTARIKEEEEDMKVDLDKYKRHVSP